MGGLVAEGKFAGPPVLPWGGLGGSAPPCEGLSRWGHCEERGWGPGGRDTVGSGLTGEPGDSTESADRQTGSADMETHRDCRRRWQMGDTDGQTEKNRRVGQAAESDSVLENIVDSGHLSHPLSLLPTSSAP